MEDGHLFAFYMRKTLSTPHPQKGGLLWDAALGLLQGPSALWEELHPGTPRITHRTAESSKPQSSEEAGIIIFPKTFLTTQVFKTVRRFLFVLFSMEP